MAVYVDNYLQKVDVKNGNRIVRGRWSHMFADTHEELEEMARLIGLKPEWIQSKGTYKEHYDLTLTRRKDALRLGAKELPIGPEWRDFFKRKRG